MLTPEVGYGYPADTPVEFGGLVGAFVRGTNGCVLPGRYGAGLPGAYPGCAAGAPAGGPTPPRGRKVGPVAGRSSLFYGQGPLLFFQGGYGRYEAI